jgi:hypothetical protein
MKKMFMLALLVVIISMFGNVVGAQTYGVKVYVDNKTVSFPDQRPYIDGNNRTLVPIRFIAEEMGTEVGWDGTKQLVTIDKGNTAIKLTIGEQRASVNGSWKHFDTSAVLYNDRTMVPLRFISETLGAEVDWDGDIRTVYIWTGKVPKNPVKPGITPFEGAKPVNAQEWVTADGPATVLRWDNPVIKYITIDELPHELDTLSIMGITVDNKFVNVTFTNKTGRQSAPDMFLAEENDITRIRNMDNFTTIDETRYLQRYAIKATFDTHPDLGNLPSEADITKMTHFIFEGRRNGQTRLLAVINPVYGGDR